jgi:hypothetical protein
LGLAAPSPYIGFGILESAATGAEMDEKQLAAEADVADFNTASELRFNNLEQRIVQLEKRIGCAT